MKSYKLIYFVIFLLPLLNICLDSYGQSSLITVEKWEKKFLITYNADTKFDENLSKSNDSWSYYKLAYGLDSYTSIFQATGNLKYLDESLLLIRNMISSAKPANELNSQYNDNYLTWLNHSNEATGDDGKEHFLYETFCWRYVTILLRILHDSPSILSMPIYRNQYERILTFTEKNIFGKWASRGLFKSPQKYYKATTHTFSHWATISLDLYYITGQRKYQPLVEEFAKDMHNAFVVNKSGIYSWNMDWDKKSKNVQDISHGNAVINTIIEYIEVGNNGFTMTDIKMLLNTFNKVIWNKNIRAKNSLKDKNINKPSLFVNGANGKGEPTFSGLFYDGFMKLARYDKATQIRLQNFIPPFNSKYRRSCQFYANGALNASFLLDGHPKFPKG